MRRRRSVRILFFLPALSSEDGCSASLMDDNVKNKCPNYVYTDTLFERQLVNT